MAIWKNQIFDAGSQNTVTKFISENTKTSCIQLEINGIYRSPDNINEFSKLVEGLACIINILGNVDWSATQIKAYRLWQASKHKPQDKVEIDRNSDNNACFFDGSLLQICSFANNSELVKVRDAAESIKIQRQTAETQASRMRSAASLLSF